MQGCCRVGGLQGVREPEGDVEGYIEGSDEKCECENAEGHDGCHGAVLDDLRRDDGVGKEGSEKGSNESCMDGCEYDQRGRALLQQGALG